MPCTVTKRISQVMPDAEFSDQTIFVPKIVIRFRHKPVWHMDRVLIGNQFWKYFSDILIIIHTVIRICQSILFITFAGTPPTTVFASTSFTTTAPAATTALSPIVTPEHITAFDPTQTFFPIWIGAG